MNEITKRRIHRGKDPFRIVQILKREVEKNKKSRQLVFGEIESGIERDEWFVCSHFL
jgi:hypothetical protein